MVVVVLKGPGLSVLTDSSFITLKQMGRVIMRRWLWCCVQYLSICARHAHYTHTVSQLSVMITDVLHLHIG